jgi:hypothetical protein
MFNMNEYEPVADRIAAFWDKYPNGRLHTEIVLINETEIVIKASAFTDRDDPRPAAIDYAQESRTSGQLVKFAVENCSTSSLGRVLATLNFQPKRENKAGELRAVRPSREEMKKVAPKTERNWATEATVLAGQGNVPGLRALYKEAQAAKVGDELLQSIKDMAKSLEK